MNVAGFKGELFEDGPEAYKTLYTYSKGLPRDAIKVCFELFIELAARNKKQATASQVEEIAKVKLPDLNCESLEAAIKTVAGTARSMGLDVVQ